MYILLLQAGLGTSMDSIFQARVPNEREDAALMGSPLPATPPAPAPAPTPTPDPGVTTTTTTTIGNFYTGEFQSKDPSRYSLNGLINVLLPGAARWIAGFLGAIAVLFLIWAGIQFLTAEGDPEKITQATKTAFYVIAGVLLVMFASALVFLFLTIFSPA